MEDYSVGSLSDLITGSNTPNKKKVIKKQFSVAKSEKRKIDSDEDDSPLEVPIKRVKEDTNNESASPKKKKKKKSKKNVSEVVEEAESESPKKKQKVKKASLNSAIEKDVSGSVEKKSKNDVNAERRVKKKEILEQKQEDTPEQKERTVFVGNLPITTKKEKLKKFFSKYGNVDTVRFRGVPVADPKTPKKVALIKKEFHPERNTFYGFVRFTTPEEAIKATEASGVLFKDHHLRIHRCSNEEKPDESKAIFVGNLGFNTEDDELWTVFGECGEISSVRIVRDGRTGMGKGFGYVNFKESDSVTLALEMENVQVKGREVRISLCNVGAAKKNKKTKKNRKISKPGAPRRKIAKEEVNGEQKDGHAKREDKGFQGSKFSEKKKKNKFNKGLAQKKKMIKKIAPQ